LQPFAGKISKRIPLPQTEAEESIISSLNMPSCSQRGTLQVVDGCLLTLFFRSFCGRISTHFGCMHTRDLFNFYLGFYFAVIKRCKPVATAAGKCVYNNIVWLATAKV